MSIRNYVVRVEERGPDHDADDTEPSLRFFAEVGLVLGKPRPDGALVEGTSAYGPTAAEAITNAIEAQGEQEFIVLCAQVIRGTSPTEAWERFTDLHHDYVYVSSPFEIPFGLDPRQDADFGSRLYSGDVELQHAGEVRA